MGTVLFQYGNRGNQKPHDKKNERTKNKEPTTTTTTTTTTKKQLWERRYEKENNERLFSSLNPTDIGIKRTQGPQFSPNPQVNLGIVSGSPKRWER